MSQLSPRNTSLSIGQSSGVSGDLKNISSYGVTSLPLNGKSSTTAKNKLTIYSRSAHMIQKIPPGTKTLILPKSVEIATAVAIDENGNIIPFSYVPETALRNVLTDRVSGEKPDVTIFKDGKDIEGKILSLNPDDVTIMSDNIIINIRNYDQIAINSGEDYTRPRLILEPSLGPVTISYLVSSIAWKCVGTALIDDIKNIMYLRLAGNIYNDTETDIEADTFLVSGDVYQHRSNQKSHLESSPQGAMMLRQTSPMSGEKVKTSMLEDYTKFGVGNRTIHNQDIAELGSWSIPVTKIYIHKTKEDRVRFGYRFVAKEFIPECSLNVYSIDADKSIDSYLGSNQIDESQASNEVDIILGESTLLECDSSVIVNDNIIQDIERAKKFKLPLDTFSKDYQKHDDREWHVIVEDLTVEIINHNQKPIYLILKHFVGDKILLETKCQNYKKRSDGFIEWYFNIPAKPTSGLRKEKFICQIITGSYH